jgi:hypothetical protein
MVYRYWSWSWSLKLKLKFECAAFVRHMRPPLTASYPLPQLQLSTSTPKPINHIWFWKPWMCSTKLSLALSFEFLVGQELFNFVQKVKNTLKNIQNFHFNFKALYLLNHDEFWDESCTIRKPALCSTKSLSMTQIIGVHLAFEYLD